MGISATAPFSARRYERRQLVIRFVGYDLTNRDLHGQIRLAPDAPGAPLVNLPLVTSASLEGVRLVGVAIENNVTVSTVAIQIATETMTDPARMPYGGEIGDDTRLAWALQVDGIQRVGGPFWVLAGVVGADGAPTNRGASWGAQLRGPEPAAVMALTFGDDRVDITIDGATLLEPLALRSEAAAARVEAVAAVADQLEGHIAAVAADRVAGDAGLQSEIDHNSARIDAVAADRVAGDAALRTDVDHNAARLEAIAADRVAGDAGNAAQIATLHDQLVLIAADRVAGDAALAARATADRQSSQATATDLASEVATRAGADAGIRNDLTTLSHRVDGLVAPPGGPADVDFDNVSEARFGDRAVISGDGTSRPLRVWIAGAPMLCDYEIEKARSLPGFTGDDAPALNALAARYQGFALSPALGARLFTKSTVQFTAPNQLLHFHGGLSSLSWERRLDHVGGPTLKFGSESASAGRFRLIDAYFVMQHRAGGGGDAYVEGQALPGLLTHEESHLEIYDGISAYVRIGGYGAVFLARTFGGAGVVFDQPNTYGGIFDPALTSAQEGLAQFCFDASPTWGHSRSHIVRDANIYGGARTSVRAVTVGSKTLYVTRRIGPKFAFLFRSCEQIKIQGGASSGFAHSNIGIDAPAGAVMQNLEITNHHLDESNLNAIWAAAGSTTLDTLMVADCIFNGQQIGRRAIAIDSNGISRPVRELTVVDSQLRSYLDGAMTLAGVDGGRLSALRLRGYNKAANDITVDGNNTGAGIIAYAATRNLLIDDIVYGGGDNTDDETAAIDPVSKMAANATQIGLLAAGATGANITYRRQRARNFGLPGGGAVLGNATVDNQP